MASVTPGRYTAEVDGEFVIFLIGMRINKIWKVHKWQPIAMAMTPMLTSLAKDPSKGLLGFRMMLGWREITLVQYWRSYEQLERFARGKDDPHLPAWRKFNQLVGTGGDVGIWHETYRVQAGAYEAIYNNMPRSGLAAATEHVPVSRKGQSSAYRLGVARVDQPEEAVLDERPATAKAQP
jgi:Domain of unknown function (DUF4188)